ncbi:MAG: cellulase family glycosylhydrolase [Phormidium sp.]
MKWHHVFPLTLFFCCLTGISNVQAATLEKENSEILVNSRFSELKRGINISDWFTDINTFNPNRITQKDLQLIKSLGFEHVRLPIVPEFLFDENTPQVLKTDDLSYLDSALDQIEAAGLSVIIDLHPKNDFKQKLATDDAFVDRVAQFWGKFAEHLSKRNPEQVFLEVINEPSFNFFLRNTPTIDPVERWDLVQTKLVEAINKGAPNHTVILKGHDWGESINSLLELTPKESQSSEKYVYNFHFYDPMLFTHQGVTWIDDEFTFIKNLPYPFNEELCTAAVAEIVDETAKIWAQGYCDQKWDAARLEKRIAKAANWAQEHNVLLTANEFGVYRQFVRPEDRTAWLGDVRSLFEKYNIGWAMWDYASPFGLVREDENGDRIVDQDMAKALGLTLPPILPPDEGSTTLPIIIPNPEIDFPVAQPDPPSPKRVPEPSAIAGFVLIIFMGTRFQRRA